ncbi:MAG: isoamylase early set domain-containing protein [Treponema sp.]|nr:isoamylase early set domain-containing protein [Treponema sp.]
MKKLLVALTTLIVSVSLATANVSAAKDDDGQVELTFTYADKNASAVYLVGDFNGWNMESDPMNRTDNGWELKLKVNPGSSVTYKFVADGNWIYDTAAPDSSDDGFGGQNGVVTIDNSGKIGKAIPKAKPREQHVEFHNWTNIGFQNAWTTTEKKDDGSYKNKIKEDSAGLGFKSYWKFTGTVTPNVPIFFELATAENEDFINLYQRDVLSWGDGFRDLRLGLFDPIAYANRSENRASDADEDDFSYLGHFKFGIAFPWLQYTMGWKYAGLPGHNNVNWTTVDSEWEAGYESAGGFGHLETGYQFTEFVSQLTDGKLRLSAAVAPNRSADRKGHRYGLYSWIAATILNNHYVDLQYNGAYGDTKERAFDDIVESDIIAGYRGTFGPVTVKANGLYNLYGNSRSTNDPNKVVRYDPDSPDVGGVDWDPDDKLDNAAANVNLTINYAPLNVVLGGRFRGYQAHMLYVKEGYQEEEQENQLSRQLGPVNTLRLWTDIGYTINSNLSVGVLPYIQKNLTDEESHSYYKNVDNMEIVVRPRFNYNLSEILNQTSSVDGYVEVSHVTEEEDRYQRGDKLRETILSEAGLRFIPRSDISIIYGYNGNPTHGVYYQSAVQNYALHSLLGTIDSPFGVTFMLGAGVRQAYDGIDSFSDTGISPWGFAFGAKKVINRTWNVTLHSEVSYNFDPFSGFGGMWGKFFLRDYVLDRANDWSANVAKFRIGVNIDF